MAQLKDTLVVGDLKVTDKIYNSEGQVGFTQNNTVIDNTIDWNHLTTPGCYRVEMAEWGNSDTCHGPNSYGNIQSYGLLLVLRTNDADPNKRVEQIFYPATGSYSGNRMPMHRSHTGGSNYDTGWGIWRIASGVWAPTSGTDQLWNLRMNCFNENNLWNTDTDLSLVFRSTGLLLYNNTDGVSEWQVDFPRTGGLVRVNYPTYTSNRIHFVHRFGPLLSDAEYTKVPTPNDPVTFSAVPDLHWKVNNRNLMSIANTSFVKSSSRTKTFNLTDDKITLTPGIYKLCLNATANTIAADYTWSMELRTPDNDATNPIVKWDIVGGKTGFQFKTFEIEETTYVGYVYCYISNNAADTATFTFSTATLLAQRKDPTAVVANITRRDKITLPSDIWGGEYDSDGILRPYHKFLVTSSNSKSQSTATSVTGTLYIQTTDTNAATAENTNTATGAGQIAWSTHYQYGGQTLPAIGDRKDGYFYLANGRLYIYDTAHMSTLDAYYTWVDAQNTAGTPVTFVFPKTHQTPQLITSAGLFTCNSGVNYVSVDNGDIYVADINRMF